MPSAATWVDIPYVTELRFPGGSFIEPRRGGDGCCWVGVLLCASPRIRADRTLHSGIQLLVDDGTLP